MVVDMWKSFSILYIEHYLEGSSSEETLAFGGGGVDGLNVDSGLWTGSPVETRSRTNKMLFKFVAHFENKYKKQACDCPGNWNRDPRTVTIILKGYNIIPLHLHYKKKAKKQFLNIKGNINETTHKFDDSMSKYIFEQNWKIYLLRTQ